MRACSHAYSCGLLRTILVCSWLLGTVQARRLRTPAVCSGLATSRGALVARWAIIVERIPATGKMGTYFSFLRVRRMQERLRMAVLSTLRFTCGFTPDKIKCLVLFMQLWK